MTLSKINMPKESKEKLTAKLPTQLIKQRDAGKGQKLSYISGSTVIDILNATFGHLGWSSEITEQWIQESTPWINKYKDNAVEEQNPVAFAKCRLTVYMEKQDGSLHSVVKEAFGSKAVIGKQSEQESTFKAAQTDALKKAASLLGIGLELYRKEEEQAYFESVNTEPVWTQETKDKYPKQWKDIQEVLDAYSWGDSELNYYVYQVTNNTCDNILFMPEEYIDSLANTMSALLEETSEAE